MEKVSIIITCYNKAKFILEAINSALNQTYPNIEVVVYNDASTDNSANIIQDIADNDKRVIFLNNSENKGVVYGRNYAISKSSGEYIFPLDGDDLIDSTYIEKAMKIFTTQPNINIVYALTKYLIDDKIIVPDKLPKINFDNLMWENQLVVSALFRKSDFYKAGQYKDYMKSAYEDWEFWISCLEQNMKFYQINEHLLTVRRGKDVKNRRNISLNINKQDELFYTLIRNHAKTYLNSPETIENFIVNTQKYRKYKNLFNIFLLVSIFELIIFGCYFLISKLGLL